jgi:hypothetical protein
MTVASNVTSMTTDEIEQYVRMARDYLQDTRPPREQTRELNAVFPAWVLANTVQMHKLRDLGFSRDEYYALRRKISADQEQARQRKKP